MKIYELPFNVLIQGAMGDGMEVGCSTIKLEEIEGFLDSCCFITCVTYALVSLGMASKTDRETAIICLDHG